MLRGFWRASGIWWRLGGLAERDRLRVCGGDARRSETVCGGVGVMVGVAAWKRPSARASGSIWRAVARLYRRIPGLDVAGGFAGMFPSSAWRGNLRRELNRLRRRKLMAGGTKPSAAALEPLEAKRDRPRRRMAVVADVKPSSFAGTMRCPKRNRRRLRAALRVEAKPSASTMPALRSVLVGVGRFGA